MVQRDLYQVMTGPNSDDDGAWFIRVSKQHGVWQVIRDGAFYGHYRDRQPAVDAARAAALKPSSRGRPAEVVIYDS